MKVENGSPVQYGLRTEEESVNLNECIGKEISLRFTGSIYCKKCGKKTKTSFQGFCFNHFQNAPEAAECILHPELCRAHLGEGRDVEWEKKNHDQPHVVYLAVSGGIKVGVTRETQIPTRWIDQGAKQAIVLAKTPNRYLAGVIEVDLKQYLSDKTNWQTMLKDETPPFDLEKELKEYGGLVDPKYAEYIQTNSKPYTFEFPLESPPKNINGLNFDKVNEVKGQLTGIKGQYLILDHEMVLNIRRHEGYEVEFESRD